MAQFLFEDVFVYLANIPEYTVFKFHIWTIVTAVFVHRDIIQILVGLLNAYFMFSTQEKVMGTVRYFIFFWWMSIISQIFIVIFGFIFFDDFFVISDGIWSMILVQVTIDSIKNANSNVTICC